MNILVIGNLYENLVSAIQKSKLPKKLFTASENPINEIPNVKYYSFENLAQKARALQIDIAVNTDNSFIEQNITEIFKENRINLITVNKKWLNLETSRLASKKLMNYYSVNNPALIKAPSEFPVVLKTDSNKSTELAYSMDELVNKMQSLDGEKKYIEEYLNGETFDLLCLWDKKNLFCFNTPNPTTEVKDDRLYLLKTKLSFMFSDEKADFCGFFTIKLLWARNDWYVREFVMGINEKSQFDSTNKDFLYILNSAIYQKLNEI